MPEEKPVNLSAALLSMAKDALTVLRELLLLILFVILLFFPKTLNTRLTAAGLTKIDGGVFTWEQKKQLDTAVDQSKAAAQANSAATDSLTQAKATITAIASQSTSERVKKQAAAALQNVEGSLSSLHDTDQSIKKTLVTQQTIQQTALSTPGQAAAPVEEAQGWVYLGEIDATGKRWTVPPEPKVAASSPLPAPGHSITLTDDVYLRADRAPGQTFSQAAINGALRAGTNAVITEVQPSPAVNGGKFIWPRVKVSSR